jgi:hypothetical protein
MIDALRAELAKAAPGSAHHREVCGNTAWGRGCYAHPRTIAPRLSDRAGSLRAGDSIVTRVTIDARHNSIVSRDFRSRRWCRTSSASSTRTTPARRMPTHKATAG